MRQPSDIPWWQASAETKPVRIVSSRSTSNFFVVAVVIALMQEVLALQLVAVVPQIWERI